MSVNASFLTLNLTEMSGSNFLLDSTDLENNKISLWEFALELPNLAYVRHCDSSSVVLHIALFNKEVFVKHDKAPTDINISIYD